MSQQCEGITAKGVQCQRVQNACRCYQHRGTEVIELPVAQVARLRRESEAEETELGRARAEREFRELMGPGSFEEKYGKHFAQEEEKAQRAKSRQKKLEAGIERHIQQKEAEQKVSAERDAQRQAEETRKAAEKARKEKEEKQKAKARASLDEERRLAAAKKKPAAKSPPRKKTSPLKRFVRKVSGKKGKGKAK